MTNLLCRFDREIFDIKPVLRALDFIQNEDKGFVEPYIAPRFILLLLKRDLPQTYRDILRKEILDTVNFFVLREKVFSQTLSMRKMLIGRALYNVCLASEDKI